MFLQSNLSRLSRFNYLQRRTTHGPSETQGSQRLATTKEIQRYPEVPWLL